jgi:hypothetical protein
MPKNENWLVYGSAKLYLFEFRINIEMENNVGAGRRKKSIKGS